jgi:alkylhydroperoxidase/carboxymuconolactone decarboxylase family protein YurZ
VISDQDRLEEIRELARYASTPNAVSLTEIAERVAAMSGEQLHAHPSDEELWRRKNQVIRLLLAEVERLRGVVEKMREAYDQKVGDLAKETLRVDALLTAAHYDGGPHMVGEAGLGWNAAMKHVRAALAELDEKG